MRYCSPLRYPGGKRKLAKFFKLLVQQNGISAHYVEPYAGGASVALALLLDEYVSHIHINDISSPIFAFWHSVLFETEALCKKISDTPVSMKEWHKQKNVQLKNDSVNLIELGFSTFFMNRTNRSGIIEGGVIGGQKQTGKWKIDARYNKDDLIGRIERIARFSNRISLYKQDALHFIRKIEKKLPPGSIFYLDPPYYAKGQDLYQNYYLHDDHLKISRIITKSPFYWAVSYDNTKRVLPLYKNFRKFFYGISYSAGHHYRGAEVMFFCDSLQIPNVGDVTKISNKLLAAA